MISKLALGLVAATLSLTALASTADARPHRMMMHRHHHHMMMRHHHHHMMMHRH